MAFFKRDVEWELQGILKAIVEADKLWDEYGQQLVVTSLMEGEHSEDSKHYVGKAADFRIRYFTAKEKKEVARELGERLGRAYFVLLERTHIHVHYKG